MKYQTIEDIIAANGLRIVLVKGFPSPWGQAAKAMMEYKGLPYASGAQQARGENTALVNWAGVNSGPVVAWHRSSGTRDSTWMQSREYSPTACRDTWYPPW